MTDREAKAIATIWYASKIVTSELLDVPQISDKEAARILLKGDELGYELLARYDLEEPVHTPFEAKQYVLEEYYGDQG